MSVKERINVMSLYALLGICAIGVAIAFIGLIITAPWYVSVGMGLFLAICGLFLGTSS